MTVKLILLKSGEDIIADVTEMRVGEDKDAKIIGYFFDKACIVKLKEGQDSLLFSMWESTISCSFSNSLTRSTSMSN